MSKKFTPQTLPRQEKEMEKMRNEIQQLKQEVAELRCILQANGL